MPPSTRSTGCSRYSKRGDDAEVAAATTQRPEQVGVVVALDGPERAVGGHDVGGEQVVDGEAVLAHQPAEPAAESEAGDAGVRHRAAGGGQPERLRLAVELAPQHPALRLGRARVGIDADALHRRQVDDEAAIVGAVPRRAVPATAHRHQQVVFAGELDGRTARRRRRGSARSPPAADRRCRSTPDGRFRTRHRSARSLVR